MAEARPTGDGDDVKKKVSLRLPNRRRFEEQMDQLMLNIRSLETELKSLGRPQPNVANGLAEETEGREALFSEQKRLRDEKEASISRRKVCDEDLKTINEQLSKQTDSLSKLDASLRFKTDAAVDDAIRKLEHQLNTRHFKLSEENRIVKEIDSLRRSKRKVREYLQQKQLIEEQRAKRKALKEKRDKYFRQVSSLKASEDKTKQKLAENKSRTDEAWTRYREAGPKREALKKEIDELYERRRQLTSEFKHQHSQYHIQVKQQRADSFRKKEEEKRAQEESRKKQREDYEVFREPYQDERQLCSVLNRYLQRYLTPDQEMPLGASALSPVQSPTSSASQSLSINEDDLNAEFVVLKKKTNDDDVFLPLTSAKRKRGIRKHSRKASWLSKPIRHTAQIFSQFESLGLRAPSSMGEVPDIIDQLISMKDEFEAKCQGHDPSSMSASLSSASHQDKATGSLTRKEPQHAAGGESKLPSIDIQSAQDHSRLQQTNGRPGTESAPQTPNSEGSVPREADGDLESVDSGIGIQRSKGGVPSQGVIHNHKCTQMNHSSKMAQNESDGGLFKNDIDSCVDLLQSSL